MPQNTQSKFQQLKSVLKQDFYRYNRSTTFKGYLKDYLTEIGANYMVWFRIASIYPNPITKFILRRKMIRYGIEIFPTTKIEGGFYIGHLGGIIVNPLAKIGKNCNISHGVTIGASKRGDKEGVPTIKDNVFIGPGAVLLGDITIGENSAIGANAVVNKDVPPNTTVGGIPATTISDKGSQGYINNTL